MPLWFPFFDSSFFWLPWHRFYNSLNVKKKLLIKEPNCTESSWQQALHWNKLHFHKRLWPSLYVTGNENSVLNKISNNNKAHKEQFSPLPLEEGKHFPLDLIYFVRKYVYSQTQQQQTRETIKYVTWLKKKKTGSSKYKPIADHLMWPRTVCTILHFIHQKFMLYKMRPKLNVS